jgi:hypothetical protein
MRSRAASLFLAVALLCAGGATPLHGQAAGLDLSELQLPAGFLELQDLVVYGSPGGGVSAVASSMFLGSAAEILVSMGPAIGGGREWLLAIQPDEWSFAEALPGLDNPVLSSLTLSGVILVVTNREITLYSATLPDDEYWFYRNAFPEDEFRLELKPGINLFGTIPSEGLAEDHPLRVAMSALGAQSGGIFLHGSLGRSLTALTSPASAGAGALRDLYLRADLPPLRPPGSPEWFRSGQLALELTGAPSVRLTGEINVYLDETELMFFVAAALARSGMSLAGGLVAEDGWQQPFGVPWLILNRVVLMLGITVCGMMPVTTIS